MSGHWVPGNTDDEGRKRPDVWVPSSGGGSATKQSAGCAIVILAVGIITASLLLSPTRPVALLTGIPTPSPLVAGSVTPTPAGAPSHTVEAVGASAAPVPAPAGVERVAPRPGEGMISIVFRSCGHADNWYPNALANGIRPPLYIVPLHPAGGGLVINCLLPAQRPPAVAQPQAPAPAQAPRQAATTAAWVRPLGGSWCFQPNGSREFGAPRPGHRHGGIDLGSPVGAHNGSPIYAIHAGTAHLGYEATGAGWYVWVDHGDGTSSWYFHESRRVAGEGQHVAAGQLIGYVGASGNAAAQYHNGVPQYHLHLETHRGGTKVDPVQFLADRGIRIRC